MSCFVLASFTACHFGSERSLTRVSCSHNHRDVINQEWSVPEGEFIVYIGSSSRDVKLLAGFTNINGILSVSTVDQAPPKGRGNGRGPPEGPRGKGPREPQGPRREKGPNGRNEPKM